MLARTELQPPVMRHQHAKLSMAVSASRQQFRTVLHWRLRQGDHPAKTLLTRSHRNKTRSSRWSIKL